jgi:hypothetical protein
MHRVLNSEIDTRDAHEAVPTLPMTRLEYWPFSMLVAKPFLLVVEWY